MNQLKKAGVPYADIEICFDEDGLIGANEVGKVTTILAKWNVFGFAYGNNFVWPFASNWANHLNTAGVKAFLQVTK